MKFCPVCASASFEYQNERHWVCSSCGFDLYNNIASAVGIILYTGNNILMIERACEPKKGMLALPGGFVDRGESLETACIRECIEEIHFTPPSVSFLCSAPNTYIYKNFEYHTCDSFFCCNIGSISTESFLSKLTAQEEEISGFKFITLKNISDIDSFPIAFDSAKKALTFWLQNCCKKT